MYLFELLYQYLEEYYFSSSLGENYTHLNFTKTSTTLLMIVGGLCLGMMIACVIAYIQKKHIGKFVRALLSEQAHDEASAKSLADLGLSKNALIKHELSHASASRKLIAIVEDGKTFTYLDELAEAFPAYAEEIRKKGLAEEQAPDTAEENKKETPEAEKDPPKEEKVTPVRKKGIRNFFFEKSFRLRKIDFEKAMFFIPDSLRIRAEFRFQEKGNSVFGLILAIILLLAVFFLCLRFIPMFVSMLDVTIGNIMPTL